jgi:ankyrin repeat protein
MLEDFKAAVEANDIALVEQLFETHPELRSRLNDPLPHCFGSTAMMRAVSNGNREMIDFLHRAGADMNARSDWWAGSFGVLDTAEPELVPFLVARGAKIDIHAAARLGMLDLVQELIEEDPALVHARGGDGQTPLHFAATIPIAKFLLDHGAGIDVRDIDHESSPAQYMVHDRQDVARFLISQGCRTDLLMASAVGDIGLVRRYLDADLASVRTTVSFEYFPKINPHSGGTIYIWAFGWHRSPHRIAREYGHDDVFQLLMERSPDSLKLLQSCLLGDEEVVHTLLASPPGIEDPVALVNAAQNNNTAGVRLMLEAGWSAAAVNPQGATALHWAGFHGNSAMAREILRYSPPLDLEEREFQGTPLGWAIYGSEHGWYRNTGDYRGTIEALEQAGAKR